MTLEGMTVQNIPLSLIDRPAAPDRITIDLGYIKELAASIAEVGLINPIVLCQRDGRYEIVAGDCRFQAHVALGRVDIPAVIKDYNPEDVSIVRATENLQRLNLSVIEEARIYRTLHDELNMSWDKIALRTGKSAGLVKRRYDLLRMPECLINAMHERKITYSVAEELFRLPELSKIQYYLGYCIDHGVTVEVVKDWVKEEFAIQRQHESVIGGGDWGSALPEQKPIYVSCDLCSGPMELKEVIQLRICKDCHATIKTNM
jgi:ParB family chromosome partitioning protein